MCASESDEHSGLELYDTTDLVKELRRRHWASTFILTRPAKNEAGFETLCTFPNDVVTALGHIEYARTRLRVHVGQFIMNEQDKDGEMD